MAAVSSDVTSTAFPRKLWLELTGVSGSPFLAVPVGLDAPRQLRLRSKQSGETRPEAFMMPVEADLNENNRHFMVGTHGPGDEIQVSVVADGHLFGPVPLPVKIGSAGELTGAGEGLQLSLPPVDEDGLFGAEALPVNLTFNLRWLGEGARRETGKFGYIVLDKRGLSNLQILPHLQSGVVHAEDEAVLARYREAFMIYDTNGDGTLSLEEYRCYLKEIERNPYDQENLDLLTRFDRTGKGGCSFVDFCRLAAHLGENTKVLSHRAAIKSNERFIWPDGTTFVRVSDRQDHRGKGGFAPVAVKGVQLLQPLLRTWTRKEAIVRVQRFCRAIKMFHWIRTRLAASKIITPFLKSKACKLIYQRIRDYAKLNDSLYSGYERLPVEVGQVSRARMRQTVANQLCYAGWGYYEPFKEPMSKRAQLKARQLKEEAEAEKREFSRHVDAAGEAEIVDDERYDDGADLSGLTLKGTYPPPFYDGMETLHFKHDREYWYRLFTKGSTRKFRLDRWWRGTVAYERGGLYLNKRQDFLKLSFKLIEGAQNREQADAAILAIYVLLVTQRKIRLLMHYGHLRSIKSVYDNVMERITSEEDETLEDDLEFLDERASNWLATLEEEEEADVLEEMSDPEEQDTEVLAALIESAETDELGIGEESDGAGEEEEEEAEPDTERETGAEAEAEAGPETEVDPEAGPEAGLDATEADPEAGLETQADPEVKPAAEERESEYEPEAETEYEPERVTEVERETEAESEADFEPEELDIEDAPPGLIGLKERKVEDLKKARQRSRLFFQCLAASIDRSTTNREPSGTATPLAGVLAQASTVELVSPWQVAYGNHLLDAGFLPEVINTSELPATGALLFKDSWKYYNTGEGAESLNARTHIPPCLPKAQSLSMAAIALTLGEKNVSFVSSEDGTETVVVNRKTRLMQARARARAAAAARQRQ